MPLFGRLIFILIKVCIFYRILDGTVSGNVMYSSVLHVSYSLITENFYWVKKTMMGLNQKNPLVHYNDIMTHFNAGLFDVPPFSRAS